MEIWVEHLEHFSVDEKEQLGTRLGRLRAFETVS